MSCIKDMTRGNPTSLILTFALPLILGNLGQQLYMIAVRIAIALLLPKVLGYPEQ